MILINLIPPKKNQILTIINNYFGYYPMEWNILKKYSWEISFEFNHISYD